MGAPQQLQGALTEKLQSALARSGFEVVVALTIARTFSSSSLYTGRRPIPDLRYDGSCGAWGLGCDMPE